MIEFSQVSTCCLKKHLTYSLENIIYLGIKYKDTLHNTREWSQHKKLAMTNLFLYNLVRSNHKKEFLD